MHTELELNKILSELRRLPTETEWVEFKAARHGFGEKDLGEYFSALSMVNLNMIDTLGMGIRRMFQLPAPAQGSQTPGFPAAVI